MRNIIKTLVVFSSIFVFGLVSMSTVYADFYSDNCPAPNYIPKSCNGVDANGDTLYEPAFDCVTAKTLATNKQSVVCCDNRCKGGQTISQGGVNQALSPFLKLKVFGRQFNLSIDKIPSVINLIISSLLAIVSLYVLLRGIYVAGIKRTQATAPDEIANINKELTNLVVGFIVLWSIIFIIQVVFALLGLGNITDFKVDTNNADPTTVIYTIQ